MWRISPKPGVLRAVLPKPVIYVLNGIAPGTADRFAEINARPVIGNLGELAEWDAFRAVQGWSGGAALHFDTGMNRLGLGPEEAPGLAARMAAMPNHGITLVMSHFACADEPDHPLNAKQIADFRDIRVMFRGIPASLANSSGIFLGSDAHFDLVRPGVALYGGNPTPRRQPDAAGGGPQSAHPAGAPGPPRHDRRLRRDMDRRADVPRRHRVDRLCGRLFARRRRRRWPSGGEALVHGVRCPIVGRVSMDLIAVDVTGAAQRTCSAATGSRCSATVSDRRDGRLGAHHQLRCAHPPGQPLPSRLEVLTRLSVLLY